MPDRAPSGEVAAQVGEHREHATVIVVGGRQVELAEDARDVLLE
jgi:hypothetical protein